MFKHIIAQAIFQFTVIIILLFSAEYYIPEYADNFDNILGPLGLDGKYKDGVVGGTIRSGRMYRVGSGEDYAVVWNVYHVYSRHLTFIFNTFVMMQVFNFINSRKLND